MADESKKLSGYDKAAIILLSVDEENAAKIFALMTEEEVKEISSSMSALGNIKSETIEQLVNEFSSEITGSAAFVGNLETTKKLLDRFLDKDKVNIILEDISGPAGKNTWDKLGNVNEDVLAAYLKNEYPQTVAMIISKLAPAHASKVLSIFPEEFTFEIIVRMLSMEPVKKEILDKIEKTLKAEFISNLTKTQKYNSTQIMAEIFNNFDRNSEAKYMGMLEQRLPESAEKIKDLMFTFDDLIKVDTAGIQALLRVIDKAKLPLALRGASEAIKTLITSNMTQRAAKLLQEDMDGLGPVKVKEVDEAQSSIIKIAREMSAKGEITISANNAAEELLY